MRTLTLAVGIMSALSLAHIAPASAAEHYGKLVSLVEVSTAGCYFFKLEGVSLADPGVPNNDWFAIPTNQANAKEMYSLLLSTRLAGNSLARVLTTGGSACGGAQVLTLNL